MKKFLALLLALTMALALVACGGGDDAASDTTADSGDDAAASTGEFEEMTWKFACSATETSPWVDGAKEFARIVGEKTGGAITVQYYPADQLTAGNQTDGIQALMDGTTELSMHSNLIWSSFDQRFNVVSLPFLFSSTEEADAAWTAPAARLWARFWRAPTTCTCWALRRTASATSPTASTPSPARLT